MDANRPIVDAHHHLWADRGDLMGSYELADFISDTEAGHEVVASVYVECSRSYRPDGPERLRCVGETEAVVKLARDAPSGVALRPAAIVAHADVTGPCLDDVLDAHEAAGNGRFRGIRHGTAWDATRTYHSRDPRGQMAERDFQRGVARIGGRGYTFDAWVYHPQLAEVADLARAAEVTTIVVDHTGGPLFGLTLPDRRRVRAEWQAGMRELARCPNVVVKLGGIGMEFGRDPAWSERAQPPTSAQVAAWWGDDLHWVVDTFGPTRCMFESNYPVDRQCLAYSVIWNAFQRVATGYSDAEQAALFAGTAARVYRLAVSALGEGRRS